MNRLLCYRENRHYFASAPAPYKNRMKGSPSFKNDKDVLPLQAADFVAWWARKQYIKDMSRMTDLFPNEWTNGKEPRLLFANLPERGIRNQFNRDIEIARRLGRELGSNLGDLEAMPWKE